MGDLIKNNNFQGISAAFETGALEELLEEASRKGGRQSGFKKKKSFAPSSFYTYGQGVCPRYWYYAFHGAHFEEDVSARNRASMDSGTAAGERIANLFKDAGILKDAEVKVVHDDPPIFGFMDLAVTWQGEDMIGEVKTTTQESFGTRAASMQAPGYQLIQLLIYMYVFQKEKGFFVVENKNTNELLIIPVKMTDERRELVENVFEWMRTVKAASDADQLPTRPFTKSSFNCKGCPVRDTCWAGTTRRGSKTDEHPGVIDLPPLEVPK